MTVFLKKTGILLFLGLITAGLSGCASFPTLGDRDAIATESQPTENPPEFFVEMHPIFAKPKVYRGVISAPVTIQEALDQSKYRKIVRSPVVDLYRQLPNGGTLKLPVEFNKKKRVKYEQDYALHPNDRIIVHSKPQSPLDRIMDSVVGEL